MRPWIPAILAAALATAGPPGAAASAAADPFAPLEDPALAGEALRKAFEEQFHALRSESSWATFSRGLMVCGKGTAEEREGRVRQVLHLLDRAGAVLGEMGLPAGEREGNPEITVVFVTVPPGAGSSVTLRGEGILLRGPERELAAPLPALRSRIDGPLLARDLREAARATVAWMASEREASRGGSPGRALREFLAARAVDGVLPDGVPAWFRAGLAERVSAGVAGGDSPPPVHLPPRWTAPSKEALEALLAAESPDPAAVPLLGRVVGDLLGKGRSGADLAGALAEATTPEARNAAAGADLFDAATTAAREIAAAGGSCGDGGTLACPACGGRKRVEVACGDCEGSGLLSCPSCFGFDDCWAGNCEGGIQVYEGGDRVRCRYCSGGRIACKACGNKKAIRCTSCRGRGRTTLACLACVGSGSLPCPSCPPAPAAGPCVPCNGGGTVACPWCAKDSGAPCEDCRGAGFLGCRHCFGTMKDLCGRCEGTGERRMVYEDGTTASATKCPACNGRGWFPCRECRNGKLVCKPCDGKGLAKEALKHCRGCEGEAVLPCAACRWSPAGSTAPGGTAEDSEANAAVLQKALAFLMTCNRTPNGAFALRARSKGKAAGGLWEPSPFSNAQVVWTLLVAGVSLENPALRKPWSVLLRTAGRIADGEIPDAGVQATAFTLRCLLVAGHAPDDPVVEKLVRRLADAQRSSGLWCYALDGSGGGDNILDSLIAVEALHVARTRGVKVPGTVWSRAYRAASSEFGTRGPTGAGRGDLDAISVVSNLALLVMAKAGSLGEQSRTFDYHSLPDVQAGLAWLDRHFSITDHPDFRAGARIRRPGGGAYFAYLFALQRLAMLLRIDEIGGQRWHLAGARHFRPLQREDGSFEESGSGAANWSVRSTCDAVLFLVRATTPITQEGAAR